MLLFSPIFSSFLLFSFPLFSSLLLSSVLFSLLHVSFSSFLFSPPLLCYFLLLSFLLFSFLLFSSSPRLRCRLFPLVSFLSFSSHFFAFLLFSSPFFSVFSPLLFAYPLSFFLLIIFLLFFSLLSFLLFLFLTLSSPVQYGICSRIIFHWILFYSVFSPILIVLDFVILFFSTSLCFSYWLGSPIQAASHHSVWTLPLLSQWSGQQLSRADKREKWELVKLPQIY